MVQRELGSTAVSPLISRFDVLLSCRRHGVTLLLDISWYPVVIIVALSLTASSEVTHRSRPRGFQRLLLSIRISEKPYLL